MHSVEHAEANTQGDRAGWLSRLVGAPKGTRIYFAEEKAPYKIRARNGRYLVCTKPFNLRKTVIYTLVDLAEEIRGTENLVFGMGAETDADCLAMIKRTEGDTDFGATEVSHRNRIPLRVVRVLCPNIRSQPHAEDKA